MDMTTILRPLLNIGMTVLISVHLGLNAVGDEIKMVSMPTTTDITRADIYYIKPVEDPIACLVMCPGINGNGQHYLTRSDLVEMANRYKLAIVGLSFASTSDALSDYRGYYSASQESGKLLIDAVDQNIKPGVPMLLYGFSGGAHFVSSFQEAFPKRVTAWCAYSAAWWEEPSTNDVCPPGIVACGKFDGDRYGKTFEYFQQGRRLGKPWCWLSLGGTSHQESEGLFRFVEAYFSAVLDSHAGDAIWCDVKTQEILDGNKVQKLDTASYLPNHDVEQIWINLHNP
jgi:hypothetical protein